MKGYTLYIRFENLCIEYPLQVMSDRQLEVSLAKLGIPGAMNIEVWDETWVILENKYFDLYTLGRGEKAELTPDAQILDNRIFYLVLKDEYKRQLGVAANEQVTLTISSYETTQSFVNYSKFKILGVPEVTIGCSSDNLIVFSDRLVSQKHARIIVNGDKVFIQDGNSKSGTFLNGVCVEGSAELHIFDEILIGNSKIVYLENIVAINNMGTNSVKLNPLTAFDVSAIAPTEVSDDTFSRSPRVLLPFDTEPVIIEAPPSPKHKDDMPPIFQYGPMITMPMPMLISMFMRMSISSGGRSSSMYGIMVFSMLASAGLSFMWAYLRKNWQKKKDAADEEFRVSQYTKYIEQNDEFLLEKITYNANILQSQYYPTKKLLLSLNDNTEVIWNRNVNHQDFLTVYLGTGKFKSPFEIKVPEQKFSLTQDALLEYPHQLKEKYEFVDNQPSLLNLRDNHIIGMLGDYEKVQYIACNIISQVAAMHSYTDVKIVVFYDEDTAPLYDWVRWLPHTFDKDKKMRYIAGTPETRERVSQVITKELNNRINIVAPSEGGQGNKNANFPYHFIIVCTNPDLFEGTTLGKCMTVNANIGATFILAYGTIDGIPNECTSIIECDNKFTGYFKLDEARDETSAINFDYADIMLHEWFARKISGMSIREVASGEIPSMIDYFASLGIGKLEQWDIRKKYKENRAYEGIKAFLGYGAGGKAMILDLHEKKYGPHGLVAGTTGSGKSETLQTAILSWMLNYSPEEVAFVLIDYKGGGMANAFIGEPHLAGTITNIPDEGDSTDEEESSESLDTNQTRRALVAIKAEIKYRQAVFRKYKVNHIDAYMKLYRKGKADSPLPHLIMISDEFAELKKEQPEFIKELVSAARVGRSLGIHLILATQKPANSVDDEIWANSRFKICLRVQDTADSNGMLKRPEAAYLTQTGRAYFQLGNNEIFEEFQSAYSGADYVPKNKIELAEDSLCKMIELDGTDTPIEIEREQRPDDAKSQLEAGIAYVTAACKSLGIAPARQLWAPQLTRKMYVEQLPMYDEFDWDKGLYACYGLIDDPEMQTQHLATFNLLTTNNIAIVGTQGYGKTTLLYTFLYSLVSHYTPNKVQFYLMDYSSRMLKMFKNVRHCGDVTNGDDELEKPQRLFKLLNAEMDRRKQLYEDNNVGSYQEYLRIAELPMILVVIDNYVMLLELYPQLEETMISFARDCVKYGMQLVVTCNKSAEIKTKVRTNILDYTTINIPKGDCRELFGVSGSFQPAPYKGRGLVLYNKRVLEYHVSLAVEGKTEFERNDNLVNQLKHYDAIYKDYKRAARIPVIPKGETYSEFYEKSKDAQWMLPFGYDMATIAYTYINLRTTTFLGLSSTMIARSGVDAALRNLVYAVKQAGINYKFYQFSGETKPHTYGVTADAVVSGKDKLAPSLLDFMFDVVHRYKERKDFLAKDPDFDYTKYVIEHNNLKVMFIDNVSKFCSFMNIEKTCYDTMLKIKTAELKAKNLDNEVYQTEYSNMSKRLASDVADITGALTRLTDLGICIVYVLDNDTMTESVYRRDVIYKNLNASKNVIHFGGSIDTQFVIETKASSTEKRKIRPANEGWGVTMGVDIHYYIAEEL